MSNPNPAIVFLTGASGFLGKVVLEELIRRSTEYSLEKVIILLRPKGGVGAQDRFLSRIGTSPCFANLDHQWHKKVEVIQGDMMQSKFGLEPHTMQRICQEITHVINCAATVAFDLSLADAAMANVGGALNLLEFAKMCPKLQRTVTTSTSYVAPYTTGPISTRLVPLPYQATTLYQKIIRREVDEAGLLRKTFYPNTYTLTKCLAEHMFAAQRDSLPVTIVRPSIISCALRYPTPGWIDSKAAVAGFVALMGAGYLRVVDGTKDAVLDVVPVDVVANDLIREAWLIPNPDLEWDDASSVATIAQAQEFSIVHSVSGVKHGLPIGMLASKIISYFADAHGIHPEAKLRKPSLQYLGQRNLMFYIHDIKAQRLPMLLTSFCFKIMRNRKMAGQTKLLAKKLKKMNIIFPYYTNRTFDFVPGIWPLGLLQTSPELLEKGEPFTPEFYAELICEGVKKHLLRL